jgi:hypothetical protein
MYIPIGEKFPPTTTALCYTKSFSCKKSFEVDEYAVKYFIFFNIEIRADSESRLAIF